MFTCEYCGTKYKHKDIPENCKNCGANSFTGTVSVLVNRGDFIKMSEQISVTPTTLLMASIAFLLMSK